MGIRLAAFSLLAGIAALGFAPGARAGDLYLTGNLAISTGTGDSGGSTGLPTPFFQNTGSDTDAAAAYGGALGLGVKLNEVIPKSWDVPLPAWGLRFEFEGMTGRDYDLRTNGSANDSFFTEVDAWTFMPNLWLDIPLAPPIAWAFGRIPILEPLSLYTGAGLGLSTVDLSTTDNVSKGSKEQFLFGWQAGVGLAYELTERVTLAAGYRYVDLGKPDVTLKQEGSEDPFGSYSLDLAAHEFNFGVRVNFWEIPYPEKWALRRDLR